MGRLSGSNAWDLLLFDSGRLNLLWTPPFHTRAHTSTYTAHGSHPSPAKAWKISFIFFCISIKNKTSHCGTWEDWKVAGELGLLLISWLH